VTFAIIQAALVSVALGVKMKKKTDGLSSVEAVHQKKLPLLKRLLKRGARAVVLAKYQFTTRKTGRR
jgi:hypothetical protein